MNSRKDNENIIPFPDLTGDNGKTVEGLKDMFLADPEAPSALPVLNPQYAEMLEKVADEWNTVAKEHRIALMNRSAKAAHVFAVISGACAEIKAMDKNQPGGLNRVVNSLRLQLAISEVCLRGPAVLNGIAPTQLDIKIMLKKNRRLRAVTRMADFYKDYVERVRLNQIKIVDYLSLLPPKEGTPLGNLANFVKQMQNFASARGFTTPVVFKSALTRPRSDIDLLNMEIWPSTVQHLEGDDARKFLTLRRGKHRRSDQEGQFVIDKSAMDNIRDTLLANPFIPPPPGDTNAIAGNLTRKLGEVEIWGVMDPSELAKRWSDVTKQVIAEEKERNMDHESAGAEGPVIDLSRVPSRGFKPDELPVLGFYTSIDKSKLRGERVSPDSDDKGENDG